MVHEASAPVSGMTHPTRMTLRHKMNHLEVACGRFLKKDFAYSDKSILEKSSFWSFRHSYEKLTIVRKGDCKDQ